MSDIENTPLTKKGLKIKIPKQEVVENVEENLESLKVSIESKPKKPRPPKTELQMEAFKKVLQKRKDILEENKKNKLINASKVLVENNIKINSIPEKDEEEEEEEVVYKVVKKPKEIMLAKPKLVRSKSKKVIKVYESSDSESDRDTSDGDSEEEFYKQWGRSAQNKKSKRPQRQGLKVYAPQLKTNLFGN
jgi:hypothetical protein